MSLVALVAEAESLHHSSTVPSTASLSEVPLVLRTGHKAAMGTA